MEFVQWEGQVDWDYKYNSVPVFVEFRGDAGVVRGLSNI